MLELKKINSEVYYCTDPLIACGPEELEFLRIRAAENPRGRARICTHRGPEDILHEMLICLTDSGYIRPHKHLTRAESYHFVDGRVRYIAFDDEGTVLHSFALGAGEGIPFYLRITDTNYHMFVIDSPYIIFHETTEGPFRPELTEYAPWAPDDTQENEVQQFMKELKSRL